MQNNNKIDSTQECIPSSISSTETSPQDDMPSNLHSTSTSIDDFYFQLQQSEILFDNTFTNMLDKLNSCNTCNVIFEDDDGCSMEEEMYMNPSSTYIKELQEEINMAKIDLSFYWYKHKLKGMEHVDDFFSTSY